MVVEEIIFALDKVGIVAFAFAGVSMGIKKKLDIFGLFIVGILTAVAGGIARDLLLSNVPYAISNIEYLMYAFVASLASIALYRFKIFVPAKPLLIADALGLGAFAAAGVVVSLNANLSILHTILFAIVTPVGGGMLRDILVNEIPFVLRKEIYATAAGIGGLAAYLVFFFGYGILAASVIALIVTILIRGYAISKNYHLPVLRA